MLSVLLHRIVNILSFVGCGDSVATINSAVVMRKQSQAMYKQMKSQGSMTLCVNQVGHCRQVSEFVGLWSTSLVLKFLMNCMYKNSIWSFHIVWDMPKVD